ncbi:hypothetical protein E4T47_05408 [Aureobasidium subglaciale]|nr:hypothetical protein E4T47_05408 [Aureobasidium subglaciale]
MSKKSRGLSASWQSGCPSRSHPQPSFELHNIATSYATLSTQQDFFAHRKNQPNNTLHTFLSKTLPRKREQQLRFMSASIENLKSFDPFAEADEDTGEIKQSNQSSYIHIRIQQRNGRKTLTTVQGLPKKFDQKKILKVIKKAFACNGTIVSDTEMGEVIQLQGDQRKDVQEFLCDKKAGLGLDAKTIKVSFVNLCRRLSVKLTCPSRSTVSKRPTTAPCTLVGHDLILANIISLE